MTATLERRTSTGQQAKTGTAEDPVVLDLYCRMSFGDDGTVYKCEDQEAQGRESLGYWAKQQGWTLGVEVVIGIVVYDHALSAWKRGVVRPGFNQIMDRVEAGVSNGVWVRDVDRFTRKMHEAVRMADAAANGGRVLGLRSDYDLSSRKGRKRFLEDAMDAEDESARISERSKDGMLNKANRGRHLSTRRGFGRPGYLPNPPGWVAGDPRSFVSDEQLAREAEAVRDAANRLLAGEPGARIADEWNDAGLLTTRGELWDTNKIRQMFESPAIAGLVSYKGQITGDRGDGPLDRETWERVLRHYSSRRRGRPATKYLLSGLATCGECGSKLYGRPRYGKREYWCQTRLGTGSVKSGCSRVSINQEFADAVVEDLVVKRLGDPRHVERIAKVAAKVQEEHARLRAERDRLNQEVDDYLSKANSAVWTKARIDAAVATYETPLAVVEARIKELEAMPEGGTPVEALEDAQAAWDAAETVEARRLLVQRAYPQGFVVSRAASSGPETLTKGRVVPTEEAIRRAARKRSK